ncbi:carbamoyltransferase HypF [uncultured Dialister sp.]|uniref:carbamoyltransferase HypF n=1 Tax=uncultured Dialister sp. TaxID=278064 RepID=UPI002632D95D|nr:carbamoyltransferase HypF [uncultured Dialister sp.]
MSHIHTFRLLIEGRVQGVGFRPFVCRAAKKAGLTGWVKNLGGLVEIRASGERESFFALEKSLQEAPYPIEVESLSKEELPLERFPDFRAASSSGEPLAPLFPADIAICPSCERELHEGKDRHFRYPFLSCTACGPRYTIIKSLPYDRPRTTMDEFPLCKDCEKEYRDLKNRRCHGETICCPRCGPKLSMISKSGETLTGEEAMERAIALVKAGEIVMVKSIGGYNLVCRGDQEETVIRLRRLKHREGKPFALMVHSLKEAETLCFLTGEDRKLLTSPARPIVLCRPKKHFSAVAEGVPRLGIFLPPSAFYDLLTEGAGGPLVVTSANMSGEPILYKDEEALSWFKAHEIDFLFTNNRDILRPADDSVVKAEESHRDMIRRTRGFLPEPALQGAKEGALLAMGADMEPSFCLTAQGRLYPGEMPCDLENESSEDAFLHMIEDWENMLGIRPERIVTDLHPRYISSALGERLSADRGIPLWRVQHHQAHGLSVMAEHGLSGKAAAFVFDGTGYGTDGTIWGGEILLLEGNEMERAGHLDAMPLLGGDISMKQAWKTALASLAYAGLSSEDSRWPLVKAALEGGVNCIRDSAMGRLFDSAAALLHIKEENRFKGECAMALEDAARQALRERRAPLPLHLTLREEEGRLIWHREELISELAGNGKIEEAALGFHRAVEEMVVESARLLGVEQVILTGGCFHNGILWTEIRNALEKEHFKVYGNEKVPCGDGGIALGQAWYGLQG